MYCTFMVSHEHVNVLLNSYSLQLHHRMNCTFYIKIDVGGKCLGKCKPLNPITQIRNLV